MLSKDVIAVDLSIKLLGLTVIARESFHAVDKRLHRSFNKHRRLTKRIGYMYIAQRSRLLFSQNNMQLVRIMSWTEIEFVNTKMFAT